MYYQQKGETKEYFFSSFLSIQRHHCGSCELRPVQTPEDGAHSGPVHVLCVGWHAQLRPHPLLHHHQPDQRREPAVCGSEHHSECLCLTTENVWLFLSSLMSFCDEVREGGAKQLDSSILHAGDLDVPEDRLLFSVVRAPQHGIIMSHHSETSPQTRPQIPVVDFTMTDLSNGTS